jgi:hypothetical protein
MASIFVRLGITCQDLSDDEGDGNSMENLYKLLKQYFTRPSSHQKKQSKKSIAIST